MVIDLTREEIETLLTSLEYSRQRISEAPGTPYDVRRDNLARIDAVAEKLRQA